MYSCRGRSRTPYSLYSSHRAAKGVHLFLIYRNTAGAVFLSGSPVVTCKMQAPTARITFQQPSVHDACVVQRKKCHVEKDHLVKKPVA